MILFLLVLLLISNSTRLFAAETLLPDNFGTLLTLDDAVARALHDHAQVKRAMERLLKEQALEKGKRAEFFPRIGANAFEALATETKHFVSYVDTTIEQPLFQGGKILAEKRKQSVRVESEKIKLTQAKTGLELAVRILYAEVLKEKESTWIAQGEVKELAQGLERVKVLFEKELIPRYDLLRAETFLQKAKQNLVSHKESYDYLLAVLKETVGIEEEESLELAPLGEITELTKDLSVYLDSSRRNHPNYKLKELAIQEKGFEKRALQADRFPKISLAGRWNLQRDVYVDTDRFMVGIVGKWNIWDFGRLGSEIKAKTHEMEETKWAQEIEIEENEKEIRRLFHAARAAREKIRLEEAFIQEKEEAYKNEKARLIAGEWAANELLGTYLALEQSKIDKILALTEYRILLVRLESHAALWEYEV